METKMAEKEMKTAEYIKDTASGRYFWVRCPVCGHKHLMRKEMVRKRNIFECAWSKHNAPGFYEPKYFRVEMEER